MARRIVVTSGKGGVGKTTVCVNLGYALANKHKKVLLVDVDFGLNNLDVVLGIENKIVYDLFDVIEGKCRPEQALVQDFNNSNLYILPTNRTFCPRIDDNRLIQIIKDIETKFDYVLIDCPAGIEDGFNRAVKLSNEAIVVTTPHISSVRDADKLITRLDANYINLVGLIVNRVRGDLIIKGDMISIQTIVSYLSLNLYGIVPEDDNIAKQLLSGGTLPSSSEGSLAYNMIATKIISGSGAIYDCESKYKGIIGAIRTKLRKFV